MILRVVGSSPIARPKMISLRCGAFFVYGLLRLYPTIRQRPIFLHRPDEQFGRAPQKAQPRYGKIYEQENALENILENPGAVKSGGHEA